MERLKSFNALCKKKAIPVRFSILKEFSFEYLLEIIETIEKIMNQKGIIRNHGKGYKKHVIQRYIEGFEEDAEKMLKYSNNYKIADGRNSFSKTDHDATFMHMKYDYYNHTNVFKPGYNVQMGSSDGYIRHVYVSSDANDLNTYIPFMEGYQMAYGVYPKITPADADGKIRCPAGYTFILMDEKTDQKGLYPRTVKTYQNEHCMDCPLRNQCTKSKYGRTLRICEQFIEYQKEAKENLMTEEGKEWMKQRSIQAEGIFGQIKQNYEYDRLWRRGETSVKLEILLVAISHNLRKYHKRKNRKELLILA